MSSKPEIMLGHVTFSFLSGGVVYFCTHDTLGDVSIHCGSIKKYGGWSKFKRLRTSKRMFKSIIASGIIVTGSK